MIKAFLLDLDHTLYDYHACNNYAISVVCEHLSKKYGKPTEVVAEHYANARKAVKKSVGNVAASHSRLLYLQKTIETLTGKTDFAETLEAHELFWNSFFSKMTLYPGVLDFLETAESEGVKIAIVSDLTAGVQLKKLRHLKIQPFVDFLVSSEEAGVEKPDSRIFQLALEKLNVAKRDVVVVGDDLERDKLGAEQFGLQFILANPQFFSEKAWLKLFE